MSILHTLAPVRVGSGTNHKIPLKAITGSAMLLAEVCSASPPRPDNTRGCWRRVTYCYGGSLKGILSAQKSLGHQHGMGPLEI
ncbi:hypothetical protein EVAR_38908_1 [Eumeta japonica]|uniref:Uncharacterized protein n=1 Tax=Eumeta variegata TaxID=151549 RepID=A0A4C1ZRH6_EUMVA|nr:hypothetical protein EVAR_38908_1 [Eumeta japonica]